MTGREAPSPLLEREHVGDVAVLRMCDPGRSNALTPAMIEQFRGALAEIDARALLVCAEGRDFCAGGDHDVFAAMSLDERRNYLRETKALLTDLRDAAVPTVACMQGAVIGGGVELALQCDLLVAADDARFQLPHVALHTRMQEESYVALVARTGLGFARRCALLGERVSASAALAAGLVDFLARRKVLSATAVSIAADVAAQPVESMAHARSAISAATASADLAAARARERT
jgi:enoyl-CoA hydratase/carnithine racemase